jgi:uncharacterized OB-fold protein
MPDTTDDILRAPLVIEYPFKRTVGPVQSAFLTGLREGILIGVRRSDGTVLCPPVEYDPETAEDLDQLVELQPEGTVTTWAWVDEPRPNHPFDRPFGWALVQLDGTSTGFLHAVDAGDEAVMSTGMRVRARFRPADEREGMITDLACFEPMDDGGPA